MSLLRHGGWMAKVVLGLCLVMTCSACSGTPSSGRSSPEVPVTLSDFHVRVANRHVAAGRIGFDIDNRGPSTHEFLIVRTDLGSSDLPLGPDGLTVDEESPQLHFVKEDPDLDIGDNRVLQVVLPPGHYVLYCNLEGHYLGGMHASLVVG
jgi:uncharacterized cupredoxin-like copper-binding protein